MADVEDCNALASFRQHCWNVGWNLLSFCFLTLASCGSIVFSGSLGVSTAISSSLTAALPPLFAPVALPLVAFADAVVFLVSAVAGVLGVVSLSLVVVLGVLTGYWC